MFTRAMRWSYIVFVWLLLGAVILQFFFAGLGVFGGANGFALHRNFGYALTFIMLLGVVVAIAARLPGRIIGLTVVLPLLVVLQSVFIAFWESGQTTLAAFHVLNGLAIFALSGSLALRSRAFVPVRPPSSVAPGGSAG